MRGIRYYSAFRRDIPEFGVGTNVLRSRLPCPAPFLELYLSAEQSMDSIHELYVHQKRPGRVLGTRLACVRRTASVHSELGSNSSNRVDCFHIRRHDRARDRLLCRTINDNTFKRILHHLFSTTRCCERAKRVHPEPVEG